MYLTEEEKQSFLEQIQNLLNIDVITKEVHDEILKILIAACARAMSTAGKG